MSEEKKKLKNAVAYFRVSDHRQLRGLSLKTQKTTCQKWADEHGYNIVRFFKDEAKSATKMAGREDLENLIIYCQDRKDIDAALTVDSDRMARNEFDHYNIKRELKKANTSYIAVNQPMIDDTPEGLLLDGMLASINAFYSRLTGKKVKNTLSKMCKEGKYPGCAKLGYRNVNIGTEDKPIKVIQVDKERAEQVKRIFELFATNRYTLDDLVIEMDGKLKSKKGKSLCRTTIDLMLKNIFYTGYFTYKGIVYKGNYEPLISKELFESCQNILAIHNKFACRRRKYKWLLNGLVHCETHDSRLFGDYAKKKTKAYYHGLTKKHCNHYIPLVDLEDRVVEELKKIKFSDEYTQVIVEKAKQLIHATKEQKESKISGIRNKISAVEIKKNTLLDGFVDGTIDKDDYERKNAEYELELQTNESEISNIRHSDQFNIDAVLEILNLTKDITTAFKKAHFEAKRYYLSLFFEQIDVNEKGEIIHIRYTQIFDTLINNNCVRIASNLLPRMDSNHSKQLQRLLSYH